MTKAGRLEEGDASKLPVPAGSNKGLSVMDFVLRLVGIAGTLGAAIAMGTNQQTLPFFTRFVQFSAEYDDFTSFRLFVDVNAIVCAYFVLSIPLSILHIIRSATSAARGSRILLIILDTVMLALLTSGASAAASIVYLAHNGNTSTNWLPVCQQYGDFCLGASGSLIGSFGAVVAFILIILLGALALSRQAKRVV